MLHSLLKVIDQKYRKSKKKPSKEDPDESLTEGDAGEVGEGADVDGPGWKKSVIVRYLADCRRFRL